MTPQLWTPSDAAGLNDFLNTKLGVKWIATLMTLKPKVEISKGTEAAGLSGAYLAGYEFLLNEIIPRTRAVAPEEANVSRKPIDMTRD
jgi:hypothetical protein